MNGYWIAAAALAAGGLVMTVTNPAASGGTFVMAAAFGALALHTQSTATMRAELERRRAKDDAHFGGGSSDRGDGYDHS